MNFENLIFSHLNTWIMFFLTMFVATLSYAKARVTRERMMSRYAVAFVWAMYGIAFLVISTIVDWNSYTARALLRLMFGFLLLTQIIYHWQYVLVVQMCIKRKLEILWNKFKL